MKAERPAVVIADTGASLTHAELDEQSARLACDLRDRGLRPGDTVGLLSAHSTDAFVVHRAVRRSGLFLLAIDTSFSLEEVAFVINDSGARALFVSAEFGPLADSLRALTPYVEVRLTLDGLVFEQAAVDAPDAPAAQHLFYSSGTTGRPHGVRRHALVAEVLPELISVGWGGVALCPAPWSDVVGSQVIEATLEAGGTVVTLAEFSAQGALQAIADHAPELVHLLPAQLLRLMKHGDRPDVAGVRAWVHSSAPCPPLAKRWLIEWVGLKVFEVYGGAQCDVLTTVDARDWLLRPGTVGRALRGRVRICGEDGYERPVGELGVVYFEAPPFLQRGSEVRDTTARRHPSHRSWFTLGDVGRVDAAGYLYLRDHESFVIDSHDARVFARDLEDLLVVHPKVRDVAVIGTADDRLGQQVRAVVQLEDGVRPGPAVERQLRAYLRSRLPASRLPDVVDFATSLPRTSTGKLVKRKLRPRFALSDSMLA